MTYWLVAHRATDLGTWMTTGQKQGSLIEYVLHFVVKIIRQVFVISSDIITKLNLNLESNFFYQLHLISLLVTESIVGWLELLSASEVGTDPKRFENCSGETPTRLSRSTRGRWQLFQMENVSLRPPGKNSLKNLNIFIHSNFNTRLQMFNTQINL